MSYVKSKSHRAWCVLMWQARTYNWDFFKYTNCVLSGVIPVVWSEAGIKWVYNDSHNTTVLGKIPENNYMFRPLIEWTIIKLKQENIREYDIR
jgi:hypothetical protein